MLTYASSTTQQMRRIRSPNLPRT